MAYLNANRHGPMYLLAHLSDPHVPPLPQPGWRELANKRVLGYLSWQRRRRHIHRRDVLDRICADLAAQNPDHIAVTGDITNISLPAEFRQARRWLDGLGTPATVSLVPGNHDAYIDLSWADGWGHWAGYMQSDQDPGSKTRSSTFPFIRKRGPLALIGLSSAVATAPGLASGRLGPEQLAGLERLLADARSAGLIRVVLLHHPPLAEAASGRKGLDDRQAFADVVARVGAELVLHGHNHRFVNLTLPGPDPSRPVPVIGVPSASALPYRDRPAAHYNLYRFFSEGGQRYLEIRQRGVNEAGEIVEMPQHSPKSIVLG